MKTITLKAILLLVLFTLVRPVQAVTIGGLGSVEGRIGLGERAGDFFEGYVSGSATSFTNTLSFDDGVLQVDYQLTIEGFDPDGNAAPLHVTQQAVGVQVLSVNDDRINAGEKVKFTYDAITPSVIGPSPMGPVDLASFQALLSTIRLSAFDEGIDTVIYDGVGAPVVVDVNAAGRQATIEVLSNINAGDMFSVTAGAGSDFRVLFLSQEGTYRTVPEPATCGLLLFGLASVFGSRRKR